MFGIFLPLENEGCQWTAYTQFSWPANTDSKAIAYVVSVSTTNQRKAYFFLKAKKDQVFSDIFSEKKSTAFITYQYLNSLLTLNSSLKTYFAANSEYQTDTKRSAYCLRVVSQNPWRTLKQFWNKLSDIGSTHALNLSIFTSPNDCKYKH